MDITKSDNFLFNKIFIRILTTLFLQPVIMIHIDVGMAYVLTKAIDVMEPQIVKTIPMKDIVKALHMALFLNLHHNLMDVEQILKSCVLIKLQEFVKKIFVMALKIVR